MRELFFVSCSRGRKEDSDLFRSLRKLGTDRFVFFEDNREGLSICYNRVLAERAGRDEILIFLHDDVTVGDLFVQDKLNAIFDEKGYDIVGLAGSSELNIRPDGELTLWLQPPALAWSGAVEHELSDGSKFVSSYGPRPQRCLVLDGVFLAVDLKRIGAVRFDEQFDFHFYDLDFCLAAHAAGLDLGTTDVYVSHKSGGQFSSDSFQRAQALFRAKWGEGKHALGDTSEAVSADRSEVRPGYVLSSLPPQWLAPLDELPLCVPVSAWAGHIPFMFLLFKLARPRTYVELGVDLGGSFLAACEAAVRFQTDTQCIGIDSWRGDKHSGFFEGQPIFEALDAFVSSQYPDCTLIRETFDNAAAEFEQGSVDVLHLDACHTYEAVSHDWAMWWPKLSNRAIVLFHDTEVRSGDFGVWRLWTELKGRYRHVEFRHAFGLGVLLVGTDIPREFLDLVEFTEASPRNGFVLQETCQAAAAELPRRLQQRGRARAINQALLDRVVLRRPSASSEPAKGESIQPPSD